MNNCPTCGVLYACGAKFCQSCGANLISASQNQTRVRPLTNVTPSQPGQGSGFTARDITSSILPPSVRPENAYEQAMQELVAMVIDVSGSMGDRYDSRYTKIEAARRAGMSTVLEKARIDLNDEIGLATFTEEGRILIPISALATHKAQILQALGTLIDGGGTDINEGLKVADSMFDWSRGNVVRRIILLTDGCGGHPLAKATELKTRGVVIDVTGVGDEPSNVNEKLLKAVASTVQGELRYRFIKDERTLVDCYTKLANKTLVQA